MRVFVRAGRLSLSGSIAATYGEVRSTTPSNRGASPGGSRSNECCYTIVIFRDIRPEVTLYLGEYAQRAQ